MARKLDIHVVPNDTRFRWRLTHAGLTLSAHRTQRRAVVGPRQEAATTQAAGSRGCPPGSNEKGRIAALHRLRRHPA